MARQQESRGREVERGQLVLRPDRRDESRSDHTPTAIVGDARVGVGKRISEREPASGSASGWDATSNAGDSTPESEWLIVDDES